MSQEKVKIKLIDQIKEAAKKRDVLFKELEAFRVFDGVADGDTDLIIEKFGDLAIVHDYGTGTMIYETISDAANEIAESIDVRSIYYRRRVKAEGHLEREEAKLIFGPRKEEILVNEGNIKFIIRPERAINGGLFLDTRDLRRFLLEKCHNKKVLNTFAYTGSLGIVAYIGGAREVVQVDSSKSILAWAKDNFEINKDHTSQKASENPMRFITEDVLTFIKRESRRISDKKSENKKDKEKDKDIAPYDLIIIDPPTFGRSSKGVFKVERDMRELLNESTKILSGNGALVISVNNASLTVTDLKKVTQSILKENSIKLKFVTEIFAPKKDFLSPLNASSVMRAIYLETSR